MAARARDAYAARVGIRIRYPNVGLGRALIATVLESDVPLLRPGDRVEFRWKVGRTEGAWDDGDAISADQVDADRGEVHFGGNVYPVANLHFLPDEQDPRSTLAEFELAD